MKRRLLILSLALATALPAFSGLASLLATGPDPAQTAPIAIAEAEPDIKPLPPVPPPPPPTTDGGSWGG